MTMRTMGVEEELLLVQPGTGQPLAVAETALDAAGQPEETKQTELAFELQRQQLETNTTVCRDLGELARAFGITAEEQLTCGCHVHGGITSADEGVAVLDRIGPWLAVLLALSANSPFWQGRDTSYASFRYQAWWRWPTAGPTEPFGTAEAYWKTVRQMTGTGTLLDSGMVYFDARLSEHYPTLEIRIADVCLHADDAVLITALYRALVDTEARRWQAGADMPRQRTEMLRLAAWRASRSGLDDVLLDPRTDQPEQAATVAKTLFDHVRDALDDASDTAAVSDLLAAVLARGNGAAFQRSVYGGDGSMSEMIGSAAAATIR